MQGLRFRVLTIPGLWESRLLPGDWMRCTLSGTSLITGMIAYIALFNPVHRYCEPEIFGRLRPCIGLVVQ